MYKRFTIYILLIVFISTCLINLQLQQGQFQFVDAVLLHKNTNHNSQVLLMPLDSRPPCTQFVEQLAAIAGIAVQLPPADYMDNYQKPGNRDALRKWFLANVNSNETAIVSVDMLIHGGLLASRLNVGDQDDTQSAIDVLKQAKTINPRLKLYVFSIIPRLIIADTPENMSHQRNMLKYSVQKDLLLTFENPLDYKKLIDLEGKLPPGIIERYTGLYEHNKRLNYALIDLAKQGIIDGLVIGQDDGQIFGLPNMAKSAIQHYIEQSNAKEKVFLTRGTDEVALTLLGYIIAKNADYKPRIFVRYSHKDAAAIVMPFMPHSVETTVNEKIHMVNGVRVTSPELADFVLYVHVGTREINDMVAKQAAGEIAAMINAGKRVAVVDLTEDYYASETIFPALLKNEVPLLRLSAYAGWNTTSNSLGTALAQVAILGASSTSSSDDHIISAWSANTEFLLCRFFDDWYFQKEIQPVINASLRKSALDPYHLGQNYKSTNSAVQKMINEKTQYWFYRQLWNKPFIIETSTQPVKVLISDFSLTAYLPWDRTFEVRLNPQLSIIKINE